MPKKKKFNLISAIVFLVFVFINVSVYSTDPAKWKTLANDGLHDPSNSTLQLLQNPGEALSVLPYDYVGNLVSWMKALDEGDITPRSTFSNTTEVQVLDLDVVMEYTGEMPLVRFPHKQHTEWLDCNNCHNKIFKMEVGANPINMFAVLQGEYCGRCHGAVAFPLTECLRCHSVARSKFKKKFGAQYKDEVHKKQVKIMADKVKIVE